MVNPYKGQWQKTRENALRLAQHQCQECKRLGKATGKNLHVHHVNPIEERPDLTYDIRNLYVCCQEHHNEFEDRTTKKLTKKGEVLRLRINRKNGIE